MKIEKRIDGDNLIINLEGRLDTNTSPELEKELSTLDEFKKIIFDMGNLEYISSAGLRVLLGLQKSVSKQDYIIIKNANEYIKEVFEITGFTDMFVIE